MSSESQRSLPKEVALEIDKSQIEKLASEASALHLEVALLHKRVHDHAEDIIRLLKSAEPDRRGITVMGMGDLPDELKTFVESLGFRFAE